MSEWLSRTGLLISKEKLALLSRSHVMVAGLGGVGGYAAEQLCRAGIGTLTLIEGDIVTVSNLNRQIIALRSTVDQKKISVMARRLYDINPYVKLHLIGEYLKEDDFSSVLAGNFDYIVDAIDTLAPKVALLAGSVKQGHRIVSSMGSGGRLDPGKITIADIEDSHHCRFAYMVRKYLHRQGIYRGITVVYSPEPVSKKTIMEVKGEENKRSVVGTISYMPPVFGCYCASVAIRDLINRNN
ncbi:MAG: tRNA threonylcarbamoyladenosine dehydratase [Bacteroidales bacterium]|nr:tRNA threonylcarbamoyladenosine dehydratase [Bacteroidales bacterium]